LSAIVFYIFRGLVFAHLIHSWEYPGQQAIGCNVVSENDSANFLSFLQTLRNLLGTNKFIISAAVSVTPFMGSNGQPMSDVSEFGDVLDYIGSLPPIASRNVL
jgi:GH18 family chitinase